MSRVVLNPHAYAPTHARDAVRMSADVLDSARAITHAGDAHGLGQLARTAGMLHTIDPCAIPDDAARTAFWLNIYNALAIHALARRARRGSLLRHLRLFTSAAYRIGRYAFTLNQIEHGVLRRNARPPAWPLRPFGRTDARRAAEPSRLDPRIHFALNCGAVSCPPIRRYDAARLDAQLALATEHYVLGHTRLNRDMRSIELPYLCKLYASDFGGRAGALTLISKHLSPADAAWLAEHRRALRVGFAPYDWSLLPVVAEVQAPAPDVDPDLAQGASRAGFVATRHEGRSSRFVTVDPERPDPALIARAARILEAGRLVAMPTETVYGLAARADDPAAIARIFDAKGRPASNPIIVHVASVEQARSLAAQWPDAAERVARELWPGAVTIVVSRAETVPDAITGGGESVGIRMPAHPVALALISALGRPLAAPSANRSSEVSPTHATHIAASFGSEIDMVLDAGPSKLGIESTVVDVRTVPLRILRPGRVTAIEIERVTGLPVLDAAAPGTSDRLETATSPGQRHLHYAPRATLHVLTRASLEGALSRLRAERVAVLLRGDEALTARDFTPAFIRQLPSDSAGFGAELYAALHDADASRCDRILVEAVPPNEPEWGDIADRLARAASPLR